MPFVRACVRVCASVRPFVMFFSRYLCCALMGFFHQTFTNSSPSDRDQLSRYWGQNVKGKFTALPSMLKYNFLSVQKSWKSTFSITPLSFDAFFPGNPCEYSHETYIARYYSHWATSSLPIVWVYFHSNFPCRLRKTHVLCNGVRNGSSRSSKVIDFSTNRRRIIRNFLLVIS